MAFGFFAQTFDGLGDIDEHYGSDVRYVKFSPPRGQNDFLRYLGGLPDHVHVGSLDQLRTYFEWGYFPERGPQRPMSGVGSLAELVECVLPDLTSADRHVGLKEQVERWHQQGLAVAGSPPHLGGELFETAWRLRGFEQFLVDLVERPQLANYLLDQLTSMMAQNAAILAQAGVDILLLDDDVAMPTGLMIGPTLWRTFFKPRLARIIRLAREVAPGLIVFYHSDGDFSALLGDLIEIGVNVVNPVQPDCMNAHAIRRAFGPKLALWGTVGTAWTWDHGSPDQIRAEVRERIRLLGPGGLLLAPAYDLDYAPRANVEAFVETVLAFG
jgi:uroporphyrinogen decarboxylase